MWQDALSCWGGRAAPSGSAVALRGCPWSAAVFGWLAHVSPHDDPRFFPAEHVTRRSAYFPSSVGPLSVVAYRIINAKHCCCLLSAVKSRVILL